ncbi:hypothetical protein [Sphingomonas hankookensis]|uniref:hypothetical protein n=1 Tax=Sphingomonas hankookensis TaxID=563996 RepID=UPI003F79D221
MAKMDIRTSGAAIKTPAMSAIFEPGFFGPGFQGVDRLSGHLHGSFLQTSLAYACRCMQPILSYCDWVAAFERRVLAQGCPCDPCQLVGQRDDDGIAVDAALDPFLSASVQRGLASRQ